MKYKIEFELPDNETVLKNIGHSYVEWRVWGYSGLAIAEPKTENCSEKPNNCEWSVEYAKEKLDTMSCEACAHWEHGAHNHYYCALLEMRQECYFESKDESTLMFANKPKDEPQTDCGDFADRLAYERGVKHAWGVAQKVFDSTVTFYEAEDVAKQIAKDEPQTDCAWK